MPLTCILTDSSRGTRLHCQTKSHPLQTRLVNQVSWLIPTLEPNCILKLINPYRPLAMYLNNRYVSPLFPTNPVS